MSEQERYDALLAEIATGVHNGHPIAGWSQGHPQGRYTAHKVTIVYTDGTPPATFTFYAFSVTPRTGAP